jgi:hypothetical protein
MRFPVVADHIDVIYPAAMRGCAKTGCEQPASASVGLRYADRVVVVADLAARFDPGLLELCGDHADRLTVPRGWVSEDRRPRADETLPADPAPVESPGLPEASEALVSGA